MSGNADALTWRSRAHSSPTHPMNASHCSAGAPNQSQTFAMKIIKVCFLSNSSNLGKNFKLVRCEEGWTVKVPCSYSYTNYHYYYYNNNCYYYCLELYKYY